MSDTEKKLGFGISQVKTVRAAVGGTFLSTHPSHQARVPQPDPFFSEGSPCFDGDRENVCCIHRENVCCIDSRVLLLWVVDGTRTVFFIPAALCDVPL